MNIIKNNAKMTDETKEYFSEDLYEKLLNHVNQLVRLDFCRFAPCLSEDKQDVLFFKLKEFADYFDIPIDLKTYKYYPLNQYYYQIYYYFNENCFYDPFNKNIKKFKKIKNKFEKMENIRHFELILFLITKDYLYNQCDLKMNYSTRPQIYILEKFKNYLNLVKSSSYILNFFFERVNQLKLTEHIELFL